eukprot:TRINITY_DN6247_c0_g1_i2.p1 TRINITY_DN6247_c0_g1~~TRINITY_DN6247_c0_g1_i2.p1  ORF type:complete len:131 (-),score=11.05 TRINITY_DN6247_c0_g1_i2:88-480(-)
MDLSYKLQFRLQYLELCVDRRIVNLTKSLLEYHKLDIFFDIELKRPPRMPSTTTMNYVDDVTFYHSLVHLSEKWGGPLKNISSLVASQIAQKLMTCWLKSAKPNLPHYSMNKFNFHVYDANRSLEITPKI